MPLWARSPCHTHTGPHTVGGADAFEDADMEEEPGSDDDEDFLDRGAGGKGGGGGRTKKSVHQRVATFPEETRESCRRRWNEGIGVEVVCNDLAGSMRQSYGRCVVQFGEGPNMQVGGWKCTVC